MRSTLRPLAAAALSLALAACATTEGPGATASVPAAEAPAALGLDTAMRLGEAAMAGGDNAAAARLFEAAARDHPDDARARRALGDAYFAMGALPEARLAYEALGRLPSQTGPAQTGLGRVALAAGDPVAAKAHFDAALAVAPADPAALNGAAVALDMQGRHAEAGPLYDRALAADPTNRAVMANKALNRALGGDPRGAARDLASLSSGPVRLPQMRHNLALAHALGGDAAAAEAILTAELSPRQAQENMDVYRRLAQR
jgi:Flp pilus assembly protein TadD